MAVVSVEELWMLLGEKDVIIYQHQKELRELAKMLELKEQENGDLRSRLSDESNGPVVPQSGD